MPEIYILLFAMFHEVVYKKHIPNFNKIISHIPIFFLVAFTKTSEFIAGHMSGKFGIGVSTQFFLTIFDFIGAFSSIIFRIRLLRNLALSSISSNISASWKAGHLIT